MAHNRYGHRGPIYTLLAELAEDQSWMRQGLCRDNPTWWDYDAPAAFAEEALKLCWSCPVQVECAEYAENLSPHDRSGWAVIAGRRVDHNVVHRKPRKRARYPDAIA